MSKRQVLVLCTGNSARSQMAEGLIRQDLGDLWEPYSAGTAPSGNVHPLAVEAMAELGLDISGQRSKSVDEYRQYDFDVVITVCDQAARTCPVWLGNGEVVHMGQPDPVAQKGSAVERLAAFRRVRDALRAQIIPYLREWRS
ncbi:MAG: arsenate reductase ArsC [Anaerolineae bacterium]|nr:arsenate reductase ArsC [Anaerolineae bacterium]